MIKHSKTIAVSMISSLLLSGFGQIPGTSQKVLAAERQAVDEITPAISAEPLETILPSVSEKPTETIPPSEPVQEPEITPSPSSSGIYSPRYTSNPDWEPGSSPIIYQPHGTYDPMPISMSFYFDDYNVRALRNESDDALILGSFEGLHELYNVNTKLERNVDYFVDSHYIKLTKEYIDKLGGHGALLYGVGESSIRGVDVRLGISFSTMEYQTLGSYKPDYPLSETNNFYTHYSVSGYFDGGTVRFGMHQLKKPDHLLLDHKEQLRNGYKLPDTVTIDKTSNIGEAMFYMDLQNEGLEPGVHFLEYVVDGKSEVLQFVRTSDTILLGNILNKIEKEASETESPEPTSSGGSIATYDPSEMPGSSEFELFKSKYIYNEGEDKTVLLNGDYKGLTRICYQGVELKEGTDYTYDDRYIKFSEDFLKQLPYTENKFTAYGIRFHSGVEASQDFVIAKLNQKICSSFEPKYPSSETNNFYTKFAYSFSTEKKADLDFGMIERKVPDAILLDGQNMSYNKNSYSGSVILTSTENIGGAVLSFYLSGYALNPGVHHLEIVTDGESEVLTFLREKEGWNYVQMLNSVGFPPLISLPPTFDMPSPSPTESWPPTSTPTPTESWPPTSSPSAPVPTCSSTCPVPTASTNIPVDPDNSSAPDITPMPTVEPPLYDNFFWMETENTYKESESASFTIPGSYMGLNHIYYKDNMLVQGVEYTIEDNLLRFSEDFLDELPYGRNSFDVYANLNPSATNARSSFCVTKIKEELQEVYKMKVDVSTSVGSSVNQFYSIQQTDSQNPLELDKLVIRYHYSKSGDKPQNFACDNAGITTNKAPYYMDYTKLVNGTIQDDYLEIGFDDSYDLKQDIMQFGIRFYQADWSAYTDFKAGYVEVLYDNSLIYSERKKE